MSPQRTIPLPAPRGRLTRRALSHIRGDSGSQPWPTPTVDEAFGDDLQLALYLCYEPHYSALPGGTADWEWDPELIAFRRAMEAAFERRLRGAVAAAPGPMSVDGDMEAVIPAIIAADDSPSVSRHMEERGTIEQMRDYVVHRSAYQLKEADPHTFGIPRLDGRAKQLLATIQSGEYGADAPDRLMHSDLFAQTMRSLGLDDRLHAYLDELPASALMISNLISLFGLNRRLRGALVGHLAVFEMTSVAPMGRYSRGLERMRAPVEARRFYDVHVLADAEHEVMALEMAAAFTNDEPDLRDDVVFGARAAVLVEQCFAAQLFRQWQAAGRTDTAA